MRMIDYIIKKIDNKLYIAENHEYKICDCTFQKFINQILIKKLTNLSALEKTTKKVFGFKNKIPLYIDNQTLLLCVRSYRMSDSVYINFHSIKNFQKHNFSFLIEFHTGHSLLLKHEASFKVQMKKAREIIDSIQS